jgi:SagB-type dehydrogenase family enzyme
VNAPEPVQTVNLARPVYGDALHVDDPAELLHEVSKIHPALVRREMSGVWALEASPALQVTTTRAVRRNPSLPRLQLPAGGLPATPLGDALRRRRSAQAFGGEPMTLDQIAAVLRAAYGVTSDPPSLGYPARRTAPSGGALYPLEVYVAVHRVTDLAPGLYHFDPLSHALEIVRCGEVDLGAVSPHGIVTEAAATLFLTATFWRSRFKYGLRAYRFTLLEAGHVAQNALLAAVALDLGGVVIGGFYDDVVDDLLALDGVNESVLVMVCFGTRAP